MQMGYHILQWMLSIDVESEFQNCYDVFACFVIDINSLEYNNLPTITMRTTLPMNVKLHVVSEPKSCSYIHPFMKDLDLLSRNCLHIVLEATIVTCNQVDILLL